MVKWPGSSHIVSEQGLNNRQIGSAGGVCGCAYLKPLGHHAFLRQGLWFCSWPLSHLFLGNAVKTVLLCDITPFKGVEGERRRHS